MVVFRSSRAASSPIFKSLRSRVVYLSNPKPRRFRNVRFKWMPREENRPPNRAITKAFDYLNQNSVSSLSLSPPLNLSLLQEFELLRPCSVTPVLLHNCILVHVDFIAKNTHASDAPEEIFFAELTLPEGSLEYSVRLCRSLGPIHSLSGDRLNGCCYCRDYNNVWHPKGGGFVRGHDKRYKTVQDICDTDMNQNNAVSNHENHLPMLKQVSQAREPTKISQHVGNASLYATEVVKFFNQEKNKNYEVVKPGFATCVILTKECSLFHLNFKAKETDPNAPVKLFFAELTTTNGVYSLKCCSVLGQSDINSGNLTGDKTNGCYYCHDFNKVRHPKYERFVRGGDSLYKPEKELNLKKSSYV